MLDQDWLKALAAAIVGSASTAMAFMVRQDRRITTSEEKLAGFVRVAEQLDKAAQKSIENGERLARVETGMAAVARTCERLEGKIDRALQSRSSL